ncbi:LexA family protein [Halomonas faecis]|uniref:LexA family protein n=1 Tax=Halomonas faecis TaxID=1562110 RepID=UPI0013D812FC|nr:LexA family transcriptional regulator [Halomonas faecis]
MPEVTARYLHRRPNFPLAQSWTELAVAPHELVDVPLLGDVAAGLPIEACATQDSVQAPASMVRRNTYALRVRGDSMIDCNIFDGDVIIIERQESAENGETAVVLINQQEVTLKTLYIERSGVRLQPANDAMPPIYLKNSDIQVLGMVMGVVRRTATTH